MTQRPIPSEPQPSEPQPGTSQPGEPNSQSSWTAEGADILPASRLPAAAERQSSREMMDGDDPEPPVVARSSVAVAGIRDPGGWLERFTDWTEETLGSESYGAPRVFDLCTLLAVTLAFALLFACLKLLEPAISVALPRALFAISLFLVLTGLGQAILWNGRKPRIASLATGPINFAVVGIALIVFSSDMRSYAVIIGLVCTSISGVPLGYLAGTVVAGVFLLADKFRERYMPTDSQDEEPVDIWGDRAEKPSETCWKSAH